MKELIDNLNPQSLTLLQKLKALSSRFYSNLEWTDQDVVEGDFYTTSRDDVELCQVAYVTENLVYTRYCHDNTFKLEYWDRNGFTSKGFGPCRVFVPLYLLVEMNANMVKEYAEWRKQQKPRANFPNPADVRFE